VYLEVPGSNLGYGYGERFLVMNSFGDVLKTNYETFISSLRAHNSNVGFTEK
jgi:hypothetical protein